MLGSWHALGHHGQHDAQPPRRRPRRHRALLPAVHRPYDGLVEGSRAAGINARSAKEAHRQRSCRGWLALDCRAGGAARRGPAGTARAARQGRENAYRGESMTVALQETRPREMLARAEAAPTNRKRVVIIGGGFAGIAAARALKRCNAEV